MKKLVLVATLGVAGLVSANSSIVRNQKIDVSDFDKEQVKEQTSLLVKED